MMYHSVQPSVNRAPMLYLRIKDKVLMTATYARITKWNHADTVIYEIDMLHFAATRLNQENWKEPRDAWVYLETFLVHYRNLLDFVGKKKNLKRKYPDLHVTDIWSLLGKPSPPTVNNIHLEGIKLQQKYEPPDEKGGGRISQYVLHCTEKRVEPKDWALSTMFPDIKPLLDEINKHLRPYAKAEILPVTPIPIMSVSSASTMTYTETASVVGWLPNTKY
jgi:hypothetical protein